MKFDYYGSSTLRGDDEIVIAAFDTETRGLGGELLSIQWGIFGQVHVDTSADMLSNFVDFILQYPAPVVWYAHFAAYDWRYMMDEFVARGLDVQIQMRSDTAVYQITLKRPGGKRVIMRDSMALWPASLADLANAFCPELPKLDIDIANFDPTNPEHLEYAKRDVEILLKGVPRLFTMLRNLFGIEANGTAASTAQKAWESQLPKGVRHKASKWDEQEAYIRTAYYGGLVFLTRNTIERDCETYDVNSSYPSVMCDYGVPSGSTCRVKQFDPDKMGIYTVRVKTPDDLVIPILPARNERGAMRWYRGEFETVVTNRELIFAINHGYELVDLREGVVWEDTAYPFGDLVGRCKAIRKQYKNLPQETLAKLMQNSLYGRFGARRERLRILASHCADPDDLLDAEPYDDDGTWYLKREFDAEMRCKPEWAVFITAHARLKLLQSAYSVGVEHVVYGDTDSLTIKAGHAEALDVGADYGQWKLEKQWSEFRAIAPKVYSGILKSGVRLAAAKGLPRKGIGDLQARELLEFGHTSAECQSLDSFRVSLKRGTLPSRTLSRVSSKLDRSVNYELHPSGQIRPKMCA